MEARNLHLYGNLAEAYGPTHRVVAASLPDALRIVECNHPGFLMRVRRGQFHCLHGAEALEDSTELAEHQIFLPRKTGDFHLMPVAEGGKGRTGKMIFSIVVGGALLATGIGGAVMAGAGGLGGAAFGASTGFLGLSYGTVALMGGAMLLGGINQLLTPTPKTNGRDDEPTSFTFSGPGNVHDEGGPIPLVYGEVITGGVTIAASIRDNTAGAASTATDPSFPSTSWGTGTTYTGAAEAYAMMMYKY